MELLEAKLRPLTLSMSKNTTKLVFTGEKYFCTNDPGVGADEDDGAGKGHSSRDT